MRQGGEGSQERACYGQNRPHFVVPPWGQEVGIYPPPPIGPSLSGAAPGPSWTVPYHIWAERSLGRVALRLAACPGVSAKGHGGPPWMEQAPLTESPAWRPFPGSQEALVAQTPDWWTAELGKVIH